MIMNTKSFQGQNVFMSRNLVPPELFDTLHDALKQNGAQVLLCCDPSRNGPNDYHVISSSDHEKFEDLRAKGCKLVGPQCVVSCAKERRPLPDLGYTCCLAMDGVKVLVSGFETDEKACSALENSSISEIEKLVTSMGGVLQTKTSSDVSFVIVKDVMASKYKWALNILKKPIVTINWLYQCRNEHRIVPQDLYRVLPFSGLTVCVTGIPADKRKEMQKLIVQNGGKYSPELTKKCTHLISDKAPEGDKYKVARRWGHIYIVTCKWFDQSISRRACLNESSYPIQAGSNLPTKASSGCFAGQQSQHNIVRNSQSALSSVVRDPNLSAVRAAESAETELEATLSQNISTMFSNPQVFAEDGDSKMMTQHPSHETNHDGCVAADSQTEEDDLYLSECRLFFVGFEVSELRKLVNLVREGGGSRYTTPNEKLTHIIVGSPSEMEKKEVRCLAALGVIHVVRSSWLEDCGREKRELPVLHKHIAYDLLRPKGSLLTNKGAAGSTIGMNQCKSATYQSCVPSSHVENVDIGVVSLEKNDEKPLVSINGYNNPAAAVSLSQQNQLSSWNDENKVCKKMQNDCNAEGKKATVFKGRKFCFSETFPEDRRAEIIEWVIQGSGEVVDDAGKQNAHFIIECHGVKPVPVAAHTTYVSTHWIRSCLEDGCLLKVGSHILYSPLPSQIPLPGFQSFRLCISQYEEKDRLLLRNLCFTLGAKFVEKLTKKVTHLLCKFKTGPKYEAAGKWGIPSITSDWIYECVRQNKVVALDRFCPKDVSSQEAVLCTSQFPSQAVQTMSRDSQSQFPSQIEECEKFRNANHITREETNSTFLGKRPRLEEDIQKRLPPSEAHLNESICVADSVGMGKMKETGEVAEVVPDVAAAIEDLLEQTSKIHDLKSLETTSCDGSPFSTGHQMLPPENIQSHHVVGLSKHWINRTLKNDDICNSSGDATPSILDGFSETQTESQVVGYEEDLSGRQMIIDRVRTQGSLV